MNSSLSTAQAITPLVIDLDHAAVRSDGRLLSDAGLAGTLADLPALFQSEGQRVLFAAASRHVAFASWQVLTQLPNNTWQTRYTHAAAVELLMDRLLHLTHCAAVREVVLVAGRAEFASPVRTLVARGVDVTVVGSRDRIAWSLAAAATRHCFLDEVPVLPAVFGADDVWTRSLTPTR